MEAQRPDSPKQSQPIDAIHASCRKKKLDDTNFLEDLRDHIDEFIHASMDEHKSCFQKTIRKMFGMSKIVADRNLDSEGVESLLALQTSVAQ